MKKRLLNTAASVLLLFNGLGALYGGLNLIAHPDGTSIHLPLQLLEHTPFENYFIPGVILFIANGLLSIITFVMLLINLKKYEWLVVIQGAILIGWIFFQIILIQTINFLHIILGLTGIGIVAIGLLLNKSTKNAIKN